MLPVTPEKSRLGRYRLLQRLGLGGTAEVFRAAHLLPDGSEQELVLKQLLPQHSRNPQVRQIFHAEAEILASLDHPNLVRLLDAGELQGTLFLALEHVDGADLERLLEQGRQQGVALPPPLAVHVVRELALALDYVHTRTGPQGKPLEIVHRDVSSRNLLIARSGAVKLSDFGIARSVLRQETTAGRGLKGTLEHMAPEQAASAALDHRTDLFGAGSVLYRALFGRPLFEGASDAEILERVRRCEVRLNPAELEPDDRVLIPILQRCLQRRPADRHGSARELAEELSRYLQGLPRRRAAGQQELAAWVCARLSQEPEPATEERVVQQLLGLKTDHTAMIPRHQQPTGPVEKTEVTLERTLPPLTQPPGRPAPDLAMPTVTDHQGVLTEPKRGPEGPVTADSRALPTGTVLGGTYRLLRPIKGGGMGLVYEAEHTRLQNLHCAVKVLHWTDAGGDDTRYSRFRREAEIITALKHPNVVRVIDFNRTELGLPYLVMELLEGEDLEALLRRKGRLRRRVLAPLIREIGGALALAHSRGVVHRDLKPSNIFLARDGSGTVQSKLLDFGISKLLEQPRGMRITMGPTILGTSAYMSPEQARGDVHQVDHRSDIFSLATIVYRCLAGTPPFRGESPVDVRAAVCHDQPVPISQLVPGSPPAIDQALARAQAKESKARYSSVGAFLNDLLPALNAPGETDERSSSGAPPAPVSPEGTTQAPTLGERSVTSLIRRRPLFIGLGSGLVFVTAVLLGWLLSRPPEESRDPRVQPRGPSRPVVEALTHDAAARPTAPLDLAAPDAGPRRLDADTAATTSPDLRAVRPAGPTRPLKPNRPGQVRPPKETKKPFLRYDDI